MNSVNAANTKIDCEAGTSTASNPIVVAGASDGSTSFSIGGEDDPYENLAECYVKISPTSSTESSTNVVFTFFHTESNRDKVFVYDGTDTSNVIATLSGDMLTPYVVQVNSGKDVLIKFSADGTDHDGGASLQLGFNATFVSGTTCFNDCSGRGSCGTNGKCTCNDESSLADDCSVRATELVVDTSIDINALAPGAWAYFYFKLTSNAGFLVDLLDIGDVSADPYLMGRQNAPPRLDNKDYAAWLDWYYDRTDVHYIRSSSGRNDVTYYVGVANYKARATDNFDGKITLRTSASGTYPCLLSCSGHGQCGTNGQCSCENGWKGTGWNYPQTCSFEVKSVVLDSTITVENLRIGDWTYYKLNINDEHANNRYLLVDFVSKEIHADPILLVRKGDVPVLRQGLIPTYGAFSKDFGDPDGFHTAIGSQSIIVKPSELDRGDWYIGVYNVWGYTGFEQESDESADFELYVNLYSAGIPCPRYEGTFCNTQTQGSNVLNTCDFNTGKCQCSDNFFGNDCSVYARPFNLKPQDQESVTLTDRTLLVGYTEYFGVKINQSSITSNLNLVIDLNKRVSGDESNPILLARFNDIPYKIDSTMFDDHDFLSNYRHADDHRIVLDNEELQAGIAVISVYNGVENLESIDLNYDITVSFQTSVTCPIGGNGQVCSNHGTCVTELGRCNCNTGYTLDDCSAYGIEEISISNDGVSTINVETSDNKFIEPDGWAFYAFPIGCVKQGIHFDLQVDATSSGDAMPLLYARQGELPLMIDGMSDFRDYYSGMDHFSLKQRFFAEPCRSNNYCVLHPASFYGSIFSTEGFRSSGDHGVDVGYWFVGIYNDVSATGPIQSYTLTFKQEFTYKTTQCAGTATCETGFLGSQCRDMCPGIAIDSGYTNAPMPSEGSCSMNGDCRYDSNGNPECVCSSSYFGESCDISCPGIDPTHGVPCYGRGTCSFSSSSETTTCSCNPGFAGESCEFGCPDSCNGHGNCSVLVVENGNVQDTYEVCSCEEGYAGQSCELSCINLCSGRGTCDSTQTCTCHDGWVSDDCSLECPFSYGEICGGNGTCAVASSGTETECICFEGRTGDLCDEIAVYSSMTTTKSGLGAGAIAGYVFLSVGVVAIIVIGLYVRRRYMKKITYYEKILADLPADDARIQSLIDEDGLEVPVDNNRVGVMDIENDQQGSSNRPVHALDSISM